MDFAGFAGAAALSPAARTRQLAGRLRLPLLGAAAFSVALATLLAARTTEAPARAAAPAAAAGKAMAGRRTAPPPEPARSGAIRPAGPGAPWSAAETSQLIDQAWGHDPAQRAAAIEALARAPRALALPALEHIVKDGEASVDRHVAVSTLHALAMGQGDADGVIRDLLRELVYDGNDEAVSDNAAAALDSLETPR